VQGKVYYTIFSLLFEAPPPHVSLKDPQMVMEM